MESWMWIAYTLAGVFAIGGVVIVIFRRRFGRNAEEAGLTAGGTSPTAYALGIAIMFFLLAIFAFIVGLGLLRVVL